MPASSISRRSFSAVSKTARDSRAPRRTGTRRPRPGSRPARPRRSPPASCGIARAIDERRSTTCNPRSAARRATTPGGCILRRALETRSAARRPSRDEPVMKARPLLTMIAIAWSVGLSAGAQQPFRSGVDVVRVDALVTDGHRPIAGLKAADFELLDNGVPQQIDSVALESQPLAVVLVLDTSGSVAGNKMAHLAAAVGVLLKGLRPADRAALVTFSHRLWLPRAALLESRTDPRHARDRDRPGRHGAERRGLRRPGTQRHRGFQAAGPGVQRRHRQRELAGGGRRRARRAPRRRRGRRRGGRGQDTISEYHNGRIVTARTEYLPGQTAFLDSIAETTGGRVIKADSTNSLPKAFDEILQEFRTRYFITYTPRERRRHRLAHHRGEGEGTARRRPGAARLREGPVARTSQVRPIAGPEGPAHDTRT